MKLADDYEKRLATFTKWPYTISIVEDMAAAGWVYKPSRFSRSRDKVKCPECRAWISCGASSITLMKFHRLFEEDCSFAQELIENVQELEAEAELDRKAMKILKARRLEEEDRRLEEEARIVVAEALEASKLKVSANDIDFFDSTLVLDFSELHLYVISVSFIDHMSTLSDFQEKGVLELLPKCLRGSAFIWFKDQVNFTSLNSFKEALAKAFPPQEPVAPVSASAFQSSPPQYHNCSECSTSFSSLTRFLQHTQNHCTISKAVCKHCEQIFIFNNKLHEHVRLLHSKPVSPPVSPPATSSRSLSPLPPKSPPNFVRCSTSSPTPPQTPSPSQTSIQTFLKRFYMIMNDLFAKFAEKARKTSVTPTKASKVNSFKSKIFEIKSDSAPRTAVPANRKPGSSASKLASISTKALATSATSTSSRCFKSDLVKIRPDSASLSARQLVNHVASTAAQTAPGISRFSPYKSTSTLRIFMSSPTPSRSSLLCALIRVIVGQLRLLIASH